MISSRITRYPPDPTNREEKAFFTAESTEHAEKNKDSFMIFMKKFSSERNSLSAIFAFSAVESAFPYRCLVGE